MCSCSKSARRLAIQCGIEIDPECTCCFVDAKLRPADMCGSSKGPGQANVRLGIQADLAAARPVDLLTRFIEARPLLARGCVVCLIAGGVPVGIARGRVVADGCMLVGDAARQVDPLTGGGIANGMAAGRSAARAARAIAVGDVSRAALSRYEDEWAAGIGRLMARNYRLRTRHSPDERTGERFLHLLALSIGAGA